MSPDGCVGRYSGPRGACAIAGPERCFIARRSDGGRPPRSEIRAADVVVIRYEGQRGGPEHARDARRERGVRRGGYRRSRGVLTDGRFREGRAASWTGQRRPPEEAVAARCCREEGDRISFDIRSERRLDVEVPEATRARGFRRVAGSRLALNERFSPKTFSLVSSARGAGTGRRSADGDGAAHDRREARGAKDAEVDRTAEERVAASSGPGSKRIS